MSGRKRVAVIGAGASGLVTARYLKKHGAQVVVFERYSGVGGQWDSASPYSGVWPSMRTNTCSVTTKFSDLQHPQNIPLYPRNQSILSYLQKYAAIYCLLENIRFATRVTLLEYAEDCWRITALHKERTVICEEFDAVVVASGRFTRPYIPDVDGLYAFTGKGGVSHSYRYKIPRQFRGMRVLVAGGSISAYEISTSLAMEGAAQIITASRRAKYLAGRLYQGRSLEYFKHTRYERLLSETLSKKENVERTKTLLLETMGRPERYNSIKPDPDPVVAGTSTSETFLSLVAEGYIFPKPWISRIDGRTVYFSDGSCVHDVDALIFCTGYDLELPFLSEPLQQIIQPTRKHIPLAWHTFHPDIPTLAFIGFWFHSGSVFVSTEQQARMIAYELCGVNKPTTRAARLADFTKYMAAPQQHAKVNLFTFSYLLSELGGFAPDMYAHPELARYLLFGPITPVTYRLSGVDALTDAPQRIIEEAAKFSVMTSGQFTEEEKQKLAQLAVRKNDGTFSAFVRKVIRNNN